MFFSCDECEITDNTPTFPNALSHTTPCDLQVKSAQSIVLDYDFHLPVPSAKQHICVILSLFLQIPSSHLHPLLRSAQMLSKLLPLNPDLPSILEQLSGDVQQTVSL